MYIHYKFLLNGTDYQQSPLDVTRSIYHSCIFYSATVISIVVVKVPIFDLDHLCARHEHLNTAWPTSLLPRGHLRPPGWTGTEGNY